MRPRSYPAILFILSKAVAHCSVAALVGSADALNEIYRRSGGMNGGFRKP